jgi:phosphatidylglycerophosphatase A
MSAPRFLLTTGGLGLLRPAPGTWGSLPPVLLALGLLAVMGPHWTIDACLALLALAGSIACVKFGAWAEAHWGRKDPGAVCADETAGQSIALLLLPWHGLGDAAAARHDLLLAALAFLAFRAFDIVKPPPARQLQALRGGWGILADDLAAGVYAAIVAQLAARLLL